MPQIVFLDRATLNDSVQLKSINTCYKWQEYPQTSPEQIISRLREAQVAVVNKVIFNSETLEQLPNLRLIAVAATGVNNIDLSAANRLGIKVCNIRDYAGDSVAEHTLAMMFALRRNLIAYRQDILDGRWQAANEFCFFGHPIDNLKGQTLGIIGQGNLGQATANRAKAIGMRVLFSERKDSQPRAGRVPFTQIFEQSDVVSVHCPLTESTFDLITENELSLMKPTALLINTARGGIVNETDLLHALTQGVIAGAASDVATQEPPAADSPIMQLAMLNNFILTPHIAWGSQSSMQQLADQLMDNVQAFLDGKPTNIINSDKHSVYINLNQQVSLN